MCTNIMQYESFHLLDPSGSVQASKAIALHICPNQAEIWMEVITSNLINILHNWCHYK
jgi:hypothetical protein